MLILKVLEIKLIGISNMVTEFYIHNSKINLLIVKRQW